MGVLKILFIIILVYYGFRLIVRIVFPFILKHFINKAQKNMNDHFGQGQFDQRQEGEVFIKHDPKKKRNIDDDQGEYVDFEDIDK